ncbi:Rrbp1 [Symbiodinium sp. CCMP2456]|nr:Rrbp1 [Symbiodinium sp. CCMP2456]
MGRGGSKGKTSKGLPNSGDSDIHLSVETGPRTYEYVGRVPNDPTPKGSGKGAKGGSTKGKGKGGKVGKPSGEPASNECRTPTPKKFDHDAQHTGSPPSMPPKGTTRGSGANSEDGEGTKSAVEPSGNKGGKGATLAGKGAADQPKGTGVLKGANVDHAGKGGKKGNKGAPVVDHAAREIGAGAMDQTEKGKGVVKGKTAVDQAGKGKTAMDQTVKGKGAVEQTGKGKTAMDQTDKGKGAVKGKTAVDQTGKGKTAMDQTGKGKPAMDRTGKGKGAVKGKTAVDQTSGKGKTAVDQTGKGKTAVDQTKGKGAIAGNKGAKGAVKHVGNLEGANKGVKGAVDTQDGKGKGGLIDHTGKRQRDSPPEHDRQVSIIRSDTNISAMSDGSGPVNMAPLATGVDAQNVPDVARPLTEAERKQIEALSGPADIPLQQRKALNEKLRRRMQNGQGLRKGLVAQWAASPPNSPARFEFLKAFLLDKENLATITVEPYDEELSENKEKEQFTELPLCLIRQKYDGVPGGKAFVENLLASQTGKKHPQSDEAEMRIYRVFDSIKTSSSNINRVGNRTGAAVTASHNRAERKAIAETLEGKVASMAKMSTAQAAPKGKGKGKNKSKKELTQEELDKKNFQKDLQACRRFMWQLGWEAAGSPTRIQKLVFDAAPFEDCLASMDYYKKEILKDYQKQVTDAEEVWLGHERKAAQKRKIQKAEEQKQKKNKEAAGQDDQGEGDEEENWEDCPDTAEQEDGREWEDEEGTG